MGSMGAMEEYNPASDTWTAKTGVPTPRSDLAAAGLDGRVYVLGGTDGTVSVLAHEYNPLSDTWTSRSSLATARRVHAAVSVGGRIFSVGGGDSGGAALQTTSQYIPLIP